MISLEGLDKAAVLAALYNASRPQGMGFLQYDPKPMTVEEARELLEQSPRFDYLKGRVMKIDLGGDELDPTWYDRDNGSGAAAKAIEAMRSGNDSALAQAHEEGKRKAAEKVKESLHEKSTMEIKDGIATLHLGLSDVADRLGPAVDKALE